MFSKKAQKYIPRVVSSTLFETFSRRVHWTKVGQSCMAHISLFFLVVGLGSSNITQLSGLWDTIRAKPGYSVSTHLDSDFHMLLLNWSDSCTLASAGPISNTPNAGSQTTLCFLLMLSHVRLFWAVTIKFPDWFKRTHHIIGSISEKAK